MLYYMSAGHCGLHIILFSVSTAFHGFYFQKVPALEGRSGVQSTRRGVKEGVLRAVERQSAEEAAAG